MGNLSRRFMDTGAKRADSIRATANPTLSHETTALQLEIAELKAENASLKARLKAAEKEISALKAASKAVNSVTEIPAPSVTEIQPTVTEMADRHGNSEAISVTQKRGRKPKADGLSAADRAKAYRERRKLKAPASSS